ncbi:MAG: hypothetical protein WD576_00255 [Nitriliruptoraceae bacterium]
MPTAAIVTLVLAGLIIAAAALGLIRVILHLVAVHRSLDALDGGVQAIVARTNTVPEVVASVNAHLEPVRDFAASIPGE